MPGFRVTTTLIFVTLACFAGLGLYYSALPGGRSLDFIFTGPGIEAALALWDAADRAHHAWGTRVLDTGFPLLYGATLVVALRRYGGRAFWPLAGLTVLAVAADFAENHSNLRLLAGLGGVGPHLVATWVKFLALALPIVVGLRGWAGELFARGR